MPIAFLLLVATALGCRSRDSAFPPRDMATARHQPRWVETIDKSHVITTLDYTIDVDECHARGRTHHVHCAGQQKAAATRFHAEIWWTWRHPCTSSVEPDIEIGERVIGVSATETPADGSGANECISGFETVIDPLAAQRWRIVGQDRFDVMLVVPNQIVH
jgi:hypothetical protein